MNNLVETRSRSGLQARTAALLLLICLAAVEFLWMGILRPALHGDFTAPYLAGSRFIHTADPYAPAGLLEEWHAEGAPLGSLLPKEQRILVYPPTTLAAVAPLALLRWPAALGVYLWGTAALYGLLVFFMMREIGAGWTSLRRLGFGAFALALAPVQSGLHLGNLSALAFVLCGFSVLCMRYRRDRAAGLMLALCFCVKPTVGFAFFFFFLFARRWRSLLWAVGLGAALAAGSLLQMARIDPAWKQSYAYNLKLMFAPDSTNSFTSPFYSRFDLLNLQLPAYVWLGNARLANLLAYGTALGLGLVWLFIFLRQKHRRPGWEWASAAVIGLLSLMPIYQRNYNAGFVLFAALWAFRDLPRATGKWVLLLCCVFLVSGEAFIRAEINHRLPDAFIHGLFWEGLVLSCANWALLLLACMMIWAVAQEGSAPGENRRAALPARLRLGRGLYRAR